MDLTQSMIAAASWLQGLFTYIRVVGVLYAIIALIAALTFTLTSGAALSPAFCFTGRRIFAFFIPLASWLSVHLPLLMLKYITYNGMVLNLFGAFEISILGPIAAPDCQAATRWASSPISCDVESFKAWMAIASQPDGLTRMLAAMPAQLVKLIGMAHLLLCWQTYKMVREWEERERKGHIEDSAALEASVIEAQDGDEKSRFGDS